MAIEIANGTQVSAVGSEHILNTNAAAGTYVLLVDLINMAAGDVLELRMKAKVLSGGTTRTVYTATFADVQADPISQSIPVITAQEISATLAQVAGSSRSFPWSLMAV